MASRLSKWPKMTGTPLPPVNRATVGLSADAAAGLALDKRPSRSRIAAAAIERERLICLMNSSVVCAESGRVDYRERERGNPCRTAESGQTTRGSDRTEMARAAI